MGAARRRGDPTSAPLLKVLGREVEDRDDTREIYIDGPASLHEIGLGLRLPPQIAEGHHHAIERPFRVFEASLEERRVPVEVERIEDLHLRSSTTNPEISREPLELLMVSAGEHERVSAAREQAAERTGDARRRTEDDDRLTHTIPSLRA